MSVLSNGYLYPADLEEEMQPTPISLSMVGRETSSVGV